ncbi:MAG: hypothetical protein DRQ41_03525 [Gammaproteobacteria bacterium]|nr:MAG: hypothetical protein DRQ41_03525 [Gammaproteobacteria bacterium]RKZ75799.1 MAG: hypothetical protein DRQ57_06200 [Gammaproteobacteria bacterium]
MTDNTPEPYREWLLAIQDSLDEEVDETQYRKTAIQQIFNLIGRDSISPQERARMKDEYSLGLLQQDKFEQGHKQGRLETARNLLAKGIEPMVVAETTGLSSEELATLSSVQN